METRSNLITKLENIAVGESLGKEDKLFIIEKLALVLKTAELDEQIQIEDIIKILRNGRISNS